MQRTASGHSVMLDKGGDGGPSANNSSDFVSSGTRNASALQGTNENIIGAQTLQVSNDNNLLPGLFLVDAKCSGTNIPIGCSRTHPTTKLCAGVKVVRASWCSRLVVPHARPAPGCHETYLDYRRTNSQSTSCQSTSNIATLLASCAN